MCGQSIVKIKDQPIYPFSPQELRGNVPDLIKNISWLEKHNLLLKRKGGQSLPAFSYILVFALTSSFGLLLALYRRLFIVLSLTDLCNNAVSYAGSLKSLKSGIQSFVLSNTDLSQNYSLPFTPLTEAIYRLSKAFDE